MMKRALITGATDGIGLASARALAEAGYAIDILGRNAQRGDQALKRMQKANPEGEHRLYLVDLGRLLETVRFLEGYRQANATLDLLILNANAYSPKLSVTMDGIERNFQVGAISRLLFAWALDPLLERGNRGRVIHVAGMHKNVAKTALDIHYDKLKAPRYSQMRSLWQAFGASGLMTHFLPQHLGSPIPHEIFDPGVVKTRQLTERHWLIRGLTHLFTQVRSPDEVGASMAEHIQRTPEPMPGGQTYKLGALQPKLLHWQGAQGAFDAFLAYADGLLEASHPEVQEIWQGWKSSSGVCEGL